MSVDPVSTFSVLRFAFLVITAAALAVARCQVDGDAVGAEAGLRFGAPVPRAVVAVVEMLFVGIRHGRDVHPLVAQAQAVNAGREFGRCEMFHRSP